MSTVEADFDLLALLDDEGWTANNHYHPLLLRHVPAECGNALEIGCGTGAFARELARRCGHVIGLDLSTEMIRVARSRAERVMDVVGLGVIGHATCAVQHIINLSGEHLTSLINF